MSLDRKPFVLLSRIMGLLQTRGRQKRQVPPVPTQGASDERDIQALVAEGNDEVAVRLVFALATLPQDRVGERYEILCKLGERYAFLTNKRDRQREHAMQEDLVQVVERLLSAPEGAQVAALRLRPRDAQARELFYEAVHYLSAAIDLNPQETRAYASRGLAYTAMDELSAAFADYTAGIQLALFPQEKARLHYLRDIAFMLQGDSNAGIDDFRRAVELDGQQVSYQEALFRAERERGQGQA